MSFLYWEEVLCFFFRKGHITKFHFYSSLFLLSITRKSFSKVLWYPREWEEQLFFIPSFSRVRCEVYIFLYILGRVSRLQFTCFPEFELNVSYDEARHSLIHAVVSMDSPTYSDWRNEWKLRIPNEKLPTAVQKTFSLSYSKAPLFFTEPSPLNAMNLLNVLSVTSICDFFHVCSLTWIPFRLSIIHAHAVCFAS